MEMIILSMVSLGVMGLLFGAALAYASKKFAVEVDPRVEKIAEVLPNANCGGCGLAGCAAFAEAVVAEQVDANACSPGGVEVAHKIAQIIGKKSSEQVSMVAAVMCSGGRAEAKDKYIYDGIEDCQAAALLAGGFKECSYGCLGMGNCVTACPFDAIIINDNGLAVVDDAKCTGCGNCVTACPRNVISLIPREAQIFLACSSHDKGVSVKKKCTVGCISCNLCVKFTPSGEVKMDNFLPVLNYQGNENFITAYHKCPQNCFVDKVKHWPKIFIDTKCTGCGECVTVCPIKGAIEGEPGERYRIITDKCIGCGRCVLVCAPRAISSVGALGYRD